MHLRVKKLGNFCSSSFLLKLILIIFKNFLTYSLVPPSQNSPPGSSHYLPDSGKLLIRPHLFPPAESGNCYH